MIKLTVLYNLPADADHEAFLKWRTTEHQRENMEMPGLIKSDFYIVTDAWNIEKAPYRYMTEAYFVDRESFEKSFYDAEYQEKLKGWLKKIAEPMFLISEEVLTEVKQN
ncbi:MAG: hypothetical protein DDG59_00825 [Anaerolineae bacterium]|jgi:hypothetical protein|nr:MAG: hypothetical protein DDG59_00825 [Anaerolineae bacterium]